MLILSLYSQIDHTPEIPQIQSSIHQIHHPIINDTLITHPVCFNLLDIKPNFNSYIVQPHTLTHTWLYIFYDSISLLTELALRIQRREIRY